MVGRYRGPMGSFSLTRLIIHSYDTINRRKLTRRRNTKLYHFTAKPAPKLSPCNKTSPPFLPLYKRRRTPESVVLQAAVWLLPLSRWSCASWAPKDWLVSLLIQKWIWAMRIMRRSLCRSTSGQFDEVFGLNISTNMRINNKKLTIAPNRRAQLEDEDVEFRRYLEKNGWDTSDMGSVGSIVPDEVVERDEKVWCVGVSLLELRYRYSEYKATMNAWIYGILIFKAEILHLSYKSYMGS